MRFYQPLPLVLRDLHPPDFGDILLCKSLLDSFCAPGHFILATALKVRPTPNLGSSVEEIDILCDALDANTEIYNYRTR